MIDLDSKLVETAQRVTTTTNEFGDIDYGTSVAVSCLYRDITMLHETSNRYEVSVDGILWFNASEPVSKGDIYYHSSEGYLKIIEIVKAKRLVADNTLQFIKCMVAKQRQVS